MLKTKFLIFSAFFINFSVKISNQAVTAVISEIISNCKVIPEDEKIDGIDLSNFQLIPVNDTHTYMNGSIKFILGFENLPGRIYTERYIRGKWFIEVFDRTYSNFCFSFHNPTEPFYKLSKSFPACPIKAGTEWKFDMMPVKGDPNRLKIIPRHYAGLWRSTIIFEYAINGETKKDCRFFTADLYEA